MSQRRALTVAAAASGSFVLANVTAQPALAKGDYCDPDATPKVCVVINSVDGSGRDISSFKVTVGASSAGGKLRIFPKFERTDIVGLIRTFPPVDIPISSSGSSAQLCPNGHISRDMFDSSLTMPCGNAGHQAWMWVGIARYDKSGIRWKTDWPGSNSNSVGIK